MASSCANRPNLESSPPPRRMRVVCPRPIPTQTPAKSPSPIRGPSRPATSSTAPPPPLSMSSATKHAHTHKRGGPAINSFLIPQSVILRGGQLAGFLHGGHGIAHGTGVVRLQQARQDAGCGANLHERAHAALVPQIAQALGPPHGPAHLRGKQRANAAGVASLGLGPRGGVG